jgi:hypothetical protein
MPAYTKPKWPRERSSPRVGATRRATAHLSRSAQSIARAGGEGAGEGPHSMSGPGRARISSGAAPATSTPWLIIWTLNSAQLERLEPFRPFPSNAKAPSP